MTQKTFKIPEPKKHAVIYCFVETMGGKKEARKYIIRRRKVNWYHSATSGGQRKYTTENKGLSGEPIKGQVGWFLEGCAEFDTWKDFLQFLRQMRAEVIKFYLDKYAHRVRA